MEESRQMTNEEVREAFLDQVRMMIGYWEHEDRVPSVHDKLWGLAHSILVILDGGSGNLPGFIVAPNPHPSDRPFNESKGENWWPENHEEDIQCDIGGSLHELLHK